MKIETIELILDAAGTLIVPIVLIGIARWFANKKESNDKAKWESEQIAKFIENLSSDNILEKRLALLALEHLKGSGHFPHSLLETIRSVATEANPVLAAQALLLLDQGENIDKLNEQDKTLVRELLYPMILHFKRTKRAFEAWSLVNSDRPNEYIEKVIRDSNFAIRELLYDKWHLIPDEYIPHASALVEHYNAWLKKYEDLRPSGIRDKTESFVFVGPDGKPFPFTAEEQFSKLYETLVPGQSRQI